MKSKQLRVKRQDISKRKLEFSIFRLPVPQRLSRSISSSESVAIDANSRMNTPSISQLFTIFRVVLSY